jgi:hypothetical protein
LDQLLDDIHPRRTIDETVRRADRAIEEFASPREFANLDSFLDHMAAFWIVCMRVMLRLESFPDASPDFIRGQCLHVLEGAFGPQGFRVAFDIAAVSGAEGGLFRVLKDFARTMAGEFSKNEITARVRAYWNKLTVDEKLAAAEEYLQKYGNLIPSGYEWNVRINLPDVLAKHPAMIQQIERIGRD